MIDNNNPKQRLLQLIIEQGILHDSPGHPLIARDGKTRLQWVMNFLGISLQHDALRLAAQEMLKLIAPFTGRQLATIGTAAVPLLSACVLESGGKYSGLMVRAQRKTYGTASLIDGRINRAEPVIVIDDSIGSGTNMLDCIAKLEQAGLHVEGCACLVRFGYDSGYAALTERGYRVLALFDQGQDISPHFPQDVCYSDNPLQESFRQILWDEVTLPDYLSPFQVIRRSMMHYWQTGKMLRPPQTFNQPVKAPGGVWLSMRAQDALYTSQGRHGFWQFPDDEAVTAPVAVSRVAWLLASYLQQDPCREQRLQQSALGLSLLGELDVCAEGGFDHRRHGLVARSQAVPWKMGGALPNMPGFSHNAQLLEHVRFHNTGLHRHEPYTLYRHSVHKLVEPGAEWPDGGESSVHVPWDEQAGIIQPLATQLYGWVRRLQDHKPLPLQAEPLFIPPECQWLFISIYTAGQQLACVGTVPHRADDLLALVNNATQDPRWQAAMQQPTKALYLHINVLSQAAYLGHGKDLAVLAGSMALGHDAVAIQHEQQFAIILPEVVANANWSARQLGEALQQKAAIAAETTAVQGWWRYRCTRWQIGEADQCQRLLPEFPLPAVAAPGNTTCLEVYLRFIRHQRQPTGIVNTFYNPALHHASQRDAVFNTAFVLWRLRSGGLLAKNEEWQSSEQYLEQVLSANRAGDQAISSLERAYAVLALLGTGDNKQYRRRLAQQLEILQQAFNRQGQLPTSDNTTAVGSGLAGDYYAAELLALLAAQQQGFLLDTLLLSKACQRLLEYARYQGTVRQYPMLLEVLGALKAVAVSDRLNLAGDGVDALIVNLSTELLRWQQPPGAFLPEGSGLSPAVFTAQALSALSAESVMQICPAGGHLKLALDQALDYLRQITVWPEQQVYLPQGEYAPGGIYSGLADSGMTTLGTANVLWALRQREIGEGGL